MEKNQDIGVRCIKSGSLGWLYVVKRNSFGERLLEKESDIHQERLCIALDVFIVWSRLRLESIPWNKSFDKDLQEVLRKELDAVISGDGIKLKSRVDSSEYIGAEHYKLRDGLINILKMNGFIILDSVEDYVQNVDEGYLYRGEDAAHLNLEPSVFRKHFKSKEYSIFEDFRKYAPKEILKQSNFSILGFMQHYGAKTRLLDVTSDRYVALYMACNTVFNSKDSIRDIGQVLLFKNRDTFSSEDGIIRLLSGLPLLRYGEKEQLKRGSKTALQQLKEAVGLPSSTYTLEELKFNRFVHEGITLPSYKQNERKKKQMGSFVIFGLDDTIKPDKVVYVINKLGILNELDKMGYNERTLIPELEHICNYINEKNS